jgi:excisionase family DNA binding protein
MKKSAIPADHPANDKPTETSLAREACRTSVSGKSCAVEVGSAERQPGRSRVKAPAIARLLYPRKDAAHMLGISVRALDYLIANKKINFRRIGSRVLIHHRELEKFASANHYESVALAA